MADLDGMLSYALTGREESRRAGLENRIGRRRSWLTELSPGDEGWTDWEGTPAEEVDALISELVALFMTRSLRAADGGADIFDAAEAFLDELTTRAGVPAVVLGQTQQLEALDHTRRSVSIRFPGSRVWDLPFLAHEFGHHAVKLLGHVEPALRDVQPLTDDAAAVTKILAAGPRPDRAAAHAGELMADAVATACCGGTYSIAALCLRVPPGAAALSSSDTHPAWRDRVATMRAVLDALTDQTGLARYRNQRAALVDPLAEAVLGSVPDATDAGATAAESTVSSLRNHRPDLIYVAADVAIDVAEAIDRRASVPPAGATVAAIVDGAWRWRLRGSEPAKEDAVAALVVGYCRSIARGRAHGHDA